MDERKRRVERAAAQGDEEAVAQLRRVFEQAGAAKECRCNECGGPLPDEFIGIETTCNDCARNHCDKCDAVLVHVVDPGPGEHWTRCPKCSPPGNCERCGLAMEFDEAGWPQCPECPPIG